MFKICRKDLKLFFSDKRSVLLGFLLPIVLITLFALAFGGGGGGYNTVTLPVADIDSTEATINVIADLDSVKGLDMEPMALEEAKELVMKGKRVGVLVFYTGFKDSLDAGKSLPMELLYDEAREMEIGILQGALISTLMESVGTSGISSHVKGFITDKYPGLDQKVLDTIMKDVEGGFDSGDGSEASGFGGGTELKMTSLVGDSKDNSLGLIQAVAGVAIMMLLFSVSSLGASLLEEKESGTLKKLLYSPINPSSLLYGKMLAGLVVSNVQLIIMFLFAWLVFGLNIGIDIPSLIIMILATAFACSSFGMFLASIARTRQQVQGLSTIIILVMSAIGGSMIPLFIMPEIMQKVAMVSVNYWAIQGFYDIFWRELPITDVLEKVGVLMCFGLVLSIIAVRQFNKNVLKLI